VQTNTATITAADQFDPDPNDNTSTVGVTPQQADLSVTKQVNSSQVFIGSNAVYTVVVRNSGADAATNVSVLDPIPVGLTFVQAAAGQGTYDPVTGVWSVGTLASGASETLRLTERVHVIGTIVNAVGVRADQFDPDLSNNLGSAAVNGVATPEILSKQSLLAELLAQPRITDFALATGMRLARPLTAGAVAVAAGPGSGSEVRVFDSSGSLVGDFSAFNSSFTGGVRVAVGDVNGDGIPDVAVAAGPGGGPNVRVFDGKTGLLLSGPLNNFMAYDASIAGGIYIAIGDVNGDGFGDIITGAGAGGGPHVKVFSGHDGSVIGSFYAYGANFRGGVRVAAGDVNGDGFADVITGAGPGGGPHVRVLDGHNLNHELASFFAFSPTFTGGVFVAAGDVNGDGRADVITGAGAGGGPHVQVFDGSSLSNVLASFFAYGPGFTGGVSVAAADLNGDGKADILTGAGPGGGPHVKAFDSAVPSHVLADFFAFDPTFLGGVFVG
jgi:uncharacterized repeat protein (TIGR01451 family)